MSQEDMMKMRIRAMLYKYQSQVLIVPDSDTELKQTLNSVIDDLVELSTMISNRENRYT